MSGYGYTYVNRKDLYGIYGWICLDIYKFVCVGYVWICLDMSGYVWIYINLYVSDMVGGIDGRKCCISTLGASKPPFIECAMCNNYLFNN